MARQIASNYCLPFVFCAVGEAREAPRVGDVFLCISSFFQALEHPVMLHLSPLFHVLLFPLWPFLMVSLRVHHDFAQPEGHRLCGAGHGAQCQPSQGGD